MNKLILTDVDNCILNWEYAFHIWLNHHGHDPIVVDQGLFYKVADQYGLEDKKVMKLVKNFNESAAIGFLPAMRDSVQYITLLANEGFRFHAVTSVSSNEDVADLRRQNLMKLFGDVFDHIECLDIASPKYQYLSQFKDSGLIFIEDHIQNAEDGLSLGLKPLLVEHGYNLGYSNPSIPKVKSWKEIYQYLNNGRVIDPDFSYDYHKAK